MGEVIQLRIGTSLQDALDRYSAARSTATRKPTPDNMAVADRALATVAKIQASTNGNDCV